MDSNDLPISLTPKVGERVQTCSKHWNKGYKIPKGHYWIDDDGIVAARIWCPGEGMVMGAVVDEAPVSDPVNHPSHYTSYEGLEIIDLTEQMNFNKGNAVKYVARAGLKDPDTEVQDLEKAVWYIQREIERIQNA